MASEKVAVSSQFQVSKLLQNVKVEEFHCELIKGKDCSQCGALLVGHGPKELYGYQVQCTVKSLSDSLGHSFLLTNWYMGQFYRHYAAEGAVF